MQIFHPRSSEGRRALLQLLQEGLRPDGAPYPIEAEYPLVLGAEAAEFSFCLGQEEAPIAHANLWPRRLLGKDLAEDISIGLVGNVVTHAAHRGRGLMRTLLAALKEEAVAQGLKALVLWSDLNEFYQKCGFTSCAVEQRWLIPRASERQHAALFKQEPVYARNAQADQPLAPSPALCLKLLGRRLKTPLTLGRSPTEFARLLAMPGVSLLGVVDPASGRCERYTVMGKGCDMIGVVHEWGAADAWSLLAGVQAQAAAHDYSEVLLLTPPSLPAGWAEVLQQKASRTTTHAMALAWAPDAAVRTLLETSFVWGLDSI